jgi:hypothetical protein
MDKIAKNQSQKQDNMQHSRQIEEASEEVCIIIEDGCTIGLS